MTTVYIDRYGVKYIAPYYITRRKQRHNHSTKGEKLDSNGKCSKSQAKKNINR